MITVSLDEGGNFENAEYAKKHMFIGGTIFKCDNETELQEELKRLQRFFMKVCKQNNAVYPVDLHFNHHGKINYDIAGKVKEALSQEAADFFQGKGVWNADKPHGQYSLYALVSDKRGIDAFWAKGISNLLSDEVASNRYEHMAYRSIENILFYNTRIPEDNSVRLDLATRLIAPKGDRELLDEVEALGHEAHKAVANGFKVTDSTGFRSALASAIQNTNRNKMQIDLNVQPIRYYKHKTNLSQGFLHMADTVCTIFDNAMHRKKDLAFAVKSLQEKCSNLVGSQNVYLWIYDEIDQGYRRAVQLYENKQYFDSMKALYDEVVANEEFAKTYEPWIQSMKKMYISNVDKNATQHAVEDLYDYMLSANEVNKALQFCNFVFDILESMCLAVKNKRGMSNTMFMLYRVDIMRHNHEGDYAGASQAYERCMKYTDYVSLEEYISLRNTKSVFLLDGLNIKESIDFTKETLAYTEKLIDVKKEIFPDDKVASITYGKVLSQLGQCFAFNKEYEQAYDCFEKAIKKFGEDSSNAKMTISFYLHAAIENNDVETYEKYAKVYFENEHREEQLEYILKLSDIAKEFAIYLFLKAQYYLYPRKSMHSILKKIEDVCDKATEAKHIDHPWEMIYKYCALLNYKIGNTNKGNKFTTKAEKCIPDATGIIKKIISNNKTECEQFKSGNREYRSELNYMYR